MPAHKKLTCLRGHNLEDSYKVKKYSAKGTLVDARICRECQKIYQKRQDLKEKIKKLQIELNKTKELNKTELELLIYERANFE